MSASCLTPCNDSNTKSPVWLPFTAITQPLKLRAGKAKLKSYHRHLFGTEADTYELDSIPSSNEVTDSDMVDMADNQLDPAKFQYIELGPLLDMMDNDHAIATQFLQMFAAEHGNDVKKLKQAIEEENFEQAILVSHSLKGVCRQCQRYPSTTNSNGCRETVEATSMADCRRNWVFVPNPVCNY